MKTCTILLGYVLCLSFLGNLFAQNTNKDSTNNYPVFSWKTVPVAFHFAKRQGGLLTSEEAQFVSSKSNFIVLEKGHGSPDYRYTEEAIREEAIRLKALNSNMKVILYWNSFLDYKMFKAHNTYQDHPTWWLRNIEGELDFKKAGLKRYDLSNPDVRNWWTDVVKNNIVNQPIDGIFMDAFIQVTAPNNIKLWGIEKFDKIQQGLKKLIKETRTKIGDDKLIAYNGIRSTPDRNIGNVYHDYTDIVMIEHFGILRSTSKESMLRDIQEMEKAGKLGKMVVFKTWPGFAWVNKEFMAKTLKEKQTISRNNITFSLAAFLAGAQEHSYIIYNWGYQMSMGSLDWYPEFNNSLGKPLDEMKIEGWELTRNYEYASVWVNLEKREAKIEWR